MNIESRVTWTNSFWRHRIFYFEGRLQLQLFQQIQTPEVKSYLSTFHNERTTFILYHDA